MPPKGDPERWRWMFTVAPTGCWLWTGPLDSQGYGRWTWREDGRRRITGVHRHVYQLLVRPLLPDEHLDHDCHNRDLDCVGGRSCLHRRCFNPDHQHPEEPRINNGRTRQPGARKRRCPQGHRYTEENTVRHSNGTRECRQCRRENNRRTQRARRGTPAGAVANGLKTHCKRRHELTPENVWVTSQGSRQCKECARITHREAKLRRKAAAASPTVTA